MLLHSLHVHTPVIESMPLKKKTGKQIFLKMECDQPVGSFKIRGIGRLCQFWAQNGKQHLVSSSGGNAGLAVAYAGKQLDMEVTVFIPSTSKQIYIDAIREQGATVQIKGDVWDEADQAAQAFARQKQAAYIPPFDDPLIWSGHSTMIDEIVEADIKPEAVIAAVGGGGLACGILEGMQQHGWHDIPFFGVETEGAASFAASIAANQLVTLPSIHTIATSLGAKRIAQQLFDWREHHPIHALTVTDLSAARACQAFANDHRILVEPSSGAALSVIYDQRVELSAFQSILVIVCGGIGISLELINTYLQEAV